MVIWIVPRYQKLMRDGIIDPAILDQAGSAWMPAFLETLSNVGGGYAQFWLLGAIVGWSLFEWLVRGENKPLIRLSGLGTVAALEAIGAEGRAASDSVAEVRGAIRDREAGRLEAALEKFRKAFAPVRDAAKRAAT